MMRNRKRKIEKKRKEQQNEQFVVREGERVTERESEMGDSGNGRATGRCGLG